MALLSNGALERSRSEFTEPLVAVRSETFRRKCIYLFISQPKLVLSNINKLKKAEEIEEKQEDLFFVAY